MPAPIASSVPCVFTAGDTVKFTLGVSGYPATAGSLAFVLTRLGAVLLSTAASASGTDFLVAITATNSASIAPGPAQWSAIYTDTATGDRSTIAAGALSILPNPAATLTQSPKQIQLAAAQVKMTELLNGFASVDFAGQTFTSHTLDSLQKIIDRLQLDVNQELRALGLTQSGDARRIQFRFCQ